VTRQSFGLALALVAVMATGLAAQDRMPPIPAEKMTPAQKEAVDAFVAARGTPPPGPFVVLLRSPELFTRARNLSDYLRFKSALPPKLSEFVILMTARAWTQQYEWNAHAPIALKAGLDPAILAAIADGRRPDKMSEEEDILYTLCDELRRTQGVSDATYARAVAKFGEQGVVDTIGLVGYYTMIAMTLNVARTPLPAGAKPALKPLPR
jgi:4-carboxymuconolactone decarboxylase